jgi:hypothetical protein
LQDNASKTVKNKILKKKYKYSDIHVPMELNVYIANEKIIPDPEVATP